MIGNYKSELSHIIIMKQINKQNLSFFSLNETKASAFKYTKQYSEN